MVANLVHERDWPYALRIVHLPGGLRAVSPAGEREVFLHATIPGERPAPHLAFEIGSYGALYKSLYALGLAPLAVDFYDHDLQAQGLEPPHCRHFFRTRDRGIWPSANAAQKWSEIRHVAAHELDDFHLADLCGRIAFELRASVIKYMDISQHYHQCLHACVLKGGVKSGSRFSDGNTFLVFLGIHSFMAEIATLRDYLAEFTANYVLRNELALRDDEYIAKMSSLGGRIRRNAPRHPLAERLRDAVDEEKQGWLATMSAYRDLILHHSPVGMVDAWNEMTQSVAELADGKQLPSLAFFLPRDPFSAKRGRAKGSPIKTLDEFIAISMRSEPDGRIEALLYCHEALGQLAVLALELAEASPVRAKEIRLGPKDILRVE